MELDESGKSEDIPWSVSTSTKPGLISRFLNLLRTLPSPGLGASAGISQDQPFLTAPSILPSLQSILTLRPVIPHFWEAVFTSMYCIL